MSNEASLETTEIIRQQATSRPVVEIASYLLSYALKATGYCYSIQTTQSQQANIRNDGWQGSF